MTITLQELNRASRAQFAQLLASAYDAAPWVAERAWAARPFVSLAALKAALAEAVRGASDAEQLALIRACAGLDGPGLDAPEPDRLGPLVAQYGARFGLPFVLAVRGPRGEGLTRVQIAAAIERRLGHHPQFERAESLRNVHRIAELRLDALFGHAPVLGNQVWDWAEELSRHSDPGYRERGQLTVTYLSDAHRACAEQIANWMREACGFDRVEIDAVGNVVGVYEGARDEAQRLLTGSHYDTVRNAGKYDGRLGILVPMACVRELHRNARRLPFAIEVVAFAEEEGQRYKATFLGSGALTGSFDPRWLDQVDRDGVTMRAAMREAGLDPRGIPAIARDPARYLGFVEVHIEQGPVLNALDLPLGVVTSINGGVRYLGEIVGQASHAGTTPMGQRRDAAAAAAELVLYMETRGASAPDLVATVGMLEVPGGSINVVPGRCRFSLDIRSTSDAVRDAAVSDVLDELARICARRELAFEIEETMRQPAAPSAADWQRRWERAVASLGVPVHRMPSGAGHDAMKLHEIMPQAMLFVRGENAGISHNPLESSTSSDFDLAVRATMALIDELAREPSR